MYPDKGPKAIGSSWAEASRLCLCNLASPLFSTALLRRVEAVSVTKALLSKDTDHSVTRCIVTALVQRTYMKEESLSETEYLQLCVRT